MNEETQDDLFNIRLTEVSKKYIRRLYPIGLISFILNNILVVVVISISVYNISKHDSILTGSFKEVYFYIYPFYIIVYSVLGVFGNYFYFTFLRKIKQGVLNVDENSYNSSFKYVYINALLFMTSTILASIFVFLDAFVVIT